MSKQNGEKAIESVKYMQRKLHSSPRRKCLNVSEMDSRELLKYHTTIASKAKLMVDAKKSNNSSKQF